MRVCSCLTRSTPSVLDMSEDSVGSATLRVTGTRMTASPSQHHRLQGWPWWGTPPAPRTGSPYPAPPPALPAPVTRQLGALRRHVLRDCVETSSALSPTTPATRPRLTAPSTASSDPSPSAFILTLMKLRMVLMIVDSVSAMFSNLASVNWQLPASINNLFQFYFPSEIH